MAEVAWDSDFRTIIHSIIIAGTHLLSSISTSETGGTIIIMAGTVITIMATIITDLISMHIIIIIQTGLLPHPILTRGIPAIIQNLPRVTIIHHEGRHHLPIIHGMKLIITGR
jgi:hypothetical protein